MVGALALDEELAGAVIGLMFSGGAALEAVASRRARRELTRLVERAPRVAQRRIDVGAGGGAGRSGAPATVLVRTGEVDPGRRHVVSDEAVVDTSTLSGEPLPVTLRRGMPVMSGTANAGAPFDIRTDRPATESAYAALVRLVDQAQAERAPFVRMADRYAGIFLPVTLAARRARVGAQRRPGPSAGRRRRGDAVPADPRRADRARVRALAGGAQRGDRQGRRRDRNARRDAHGAVRQDRHADGRGPRGRTSWRSDDRSTAEVLRLAASVDRLSAHVLGEALVSAAEDAELTLDNAPRGPR